MLRPLRRLASHPRNAARFQAAAIFGGREYFERTTGLTYAEYVHQGFGQLTFATLLTLLTVALAARKAPRRTERDREYVAVLSDQCGAKDVHDARLAREVNAGRQAKEAPRGLNG